MSSGNENASNDKQAVDSSGLEHYNPPLKSSVAQQQSLESFDGRGHKVPFNLSTWGYSVLVILVTTVIVGAAVGGGVGGGIKRNAAPRFV